NARIGAVHEDGAKRLAAIEKLCSDVETLSQLVLEDRSRPRQRGGSFKQWLYGTEDWLKASWRKPSALRLRPPPPPMRVVERVDRRPGQSGRWPRLVKRRGSPL